MKRIQVQGRRTLTISLRSGKEEVEAPRRENVGGRRVHPS